MADDAIAYPPYERTEYLIGIVSIMLNNYKFGCYELSSISDTGTELQVRMQPFFGVYDGSTG